MPAFERLQCVEVVGLVSDEGQKLNGKIGAVMRYLTDSDRYEVSLSADGSTIANLRAVNIRQLDPKTVADRNIAAFLGGSTSSAAGVASGATGMAQPKASGETENDENLAPAAELAEKRDESSAVSAENAPQKKAKGRGKRAADESKQAAGDHEVAKPEKGAVSEEPATEKRAKGRGRKVAMEEPKVDALVPAPSQAKAGEQQEAVSVPPAAKRGRGREKAVHKGEAAKTIEAHTDAAKEEKTAESTKDLESKRGRRGVKQPPAAVDPAAAAAAGVPAGVSTPKAPRKRPSDEAAATTPGSAPKRGRPARGAEATAKAGKEAGGEAPLGKKDTKTPAQRTKTPKGKGQPGDAAATDEQALEEADALGLAGALRNLAAREAIQDRRFSLSALLSALREADGLVNKAKAALLGA